LAELVQLSVGDPIIDDARSGIMKGFGCGLTEGTGGSFSPSAREMMALSLN